MKKILLILAACLLCSCSAIKHKSGDFRDGAESRDAEKVKTFSIAPYQVMGMGVGPLLCYLVKADKEKSWRMFSAGIHGFEFEPGMGYRLKVKETPVDHPPADGSSLRYDLVEVIEKNAVVQSLDSLHGTWKVVRLNGTQPVPMDVEQTMTLDTAAMTIAGTGGVNRYRGRVEGTEGSSGIGFKKMMSTRMAGPNLSQENTFFKILDQVDGYFRCDSSLLLLSDKQVVVEAKIAE